MTETPVNNPMKVFAAAAFAAALFSCMNVFIKLSADMGHSVVQIMFFRNGIALIPLLVVIASHKRGFGLLKTQRPVGHVVRSVIGTVSMLFCFWSFALMPMANATALHFAAPLILTAMSVPFLNERVGPWRWAAVGVGLLGVLVIINPTGNLDPLGTTVALTAAFGIAAAMVCIRKLGNTEHSLTIVFYFFLTGTIMTAIAMPWYWSAPSFLGFFYMVMSGISGMVAQIFLTNAYANAPAAYVSPFNYLGIVFATFFGWAIWADVPAAHVMIGAGIVILSGLFILYRETVVKKRVLKPTLSPEAVPDPEIYAAIPKANLAPDPAHETGQTTQADIQDRP